MLCDLFVDPARHGSGCGRAMLAELWPGRGRRMTFSSLHGHALPLYTSFGLAGLEPADGRACVCLPGPHPAVRALLAAGWRVEDFDLYMATTPSLLDPRRAVPSPALA